MYRHNMLTPAFPSALFNALRLSALPDVVVPQLERMTANLTSWRNKEDKFELSIAVPGLGPEDINVELEDRVASLTINTDNQKAVMRVRIPQGSDPSTLEAKLARGLLTLTLSQAPEHKARTIQVVEVVEPVATTVSADSVQES